jgi:hypothetical protein
VQFAERCANILLPYQAYVNFERNNQGYAFGAKFVEKYPQKLIHRTRSKLKTHKLNATEMEKLSDWGMVTTHISKPLIIGKLRTRLRECSLIIYSEALKMECHSFVEHPDGELEAAQGCFDDRVMAAALAVEVFPKAALVGNASKGETIRKRNRTTADIFSGGALIAELEARYASQGNNLPISSGVIE